MLSIGFIIVLRKEGCDSLLAIWDMFDVFGLGLRLVVLEGRGRSGSAADTKVVGLREVGGMSL